MQVLGLFLCSKLNHSILCLLIMYQTLKLFLKCVCRAVV